MTNNDIQETVRKKYGELAREVTNNNSSCGPSLPCCDPISKDLYHSEEMSSIPREAAAASLGCGNPLAIAQLNPGETVLDLGSGGGIDVLLSAKRVGPSGFVYGLDMTDEMLALAGANQAKAGVSNVQFLKGEIENIPLPDGSVDVIISNCVINLSIDKGRVIRELARVLRPGGRVAISDVVVRGEVPENIRKHVDLWIGCVAGALQESEYAELLKKAGLSNIEIEPWRIYKSEEMRAALEAAGLDFATAASVVEGKFASASIRARKN